MPKNINKRVYLGGNFLLMFLFKNDFLRGFFFFFFFFKTSTEKLKCSLSYHFKNLVCVLAKLFLCHIYLHTLYIEE